MADDEIRDSSDGSENEMIKGDLKKEVKDKPEMEDDNKKMEEDNKENVENAVGNNPPKSNMKSPGGRQGKKAQKTKRVQLQMTSDLKAKDDPPKDELNNIVNANDVKESQDKNEPKKDELNNIVHANDVKEPQEKVKDEDNEGDDDDDDDDDDDVVDIHFSPPIDVKKILDTILLVIYFFGSLLRKCLGFVKSTVQRVYEMVKSVLPVTVAAGLYVLVMYLVGSYLLESEPFKGDGMNYVVRQMALVLLPSTLALVVNRLQPHTVYKKFLTQSIEDVVLILVNSLVLVTHLDAEYYVWLYALLVVSTAYRFCHWLSLLYCSPRIQYFLSTPIQLTHIGLGMYNAYNIISKDLGFTVGGRPTSEVSVQTDDDPELPDWKYPDICGVVDRIFCKVD